LRALRVAGEFAPGERLPTVRRFATDLGVHHNTVAESRRVLAEEGCLDLRRGGAGSPGPSRTACRAALANHMPALAKKFVKPWKRAGGVGHSRADGDSAARSRRTRDS
jgi:DNA-binding transcriptional regulator YhcF (GntR family)